MKLLVAIKLFTLPFFLRILLNKVVVKAISSNKIFFSFVIYSDRTKLQKILVARRKNRAETVLPAELRFNHNKAVMFRNIVTPNYEVIRFLSIVPDFLRPLFIEYHSDKFTTQNEWKLALGKLYFFKGLDKNNSPILQSKKIFDLKANDGKKLNEIFVGDGKSLPNFHRDLFHSWEKGKYTGIDFFDGSNWLSGKSPKDYYETFLELFISDNVLFENGILEDQKEKKFLQETFIPAFIKVWIKTGQRPLITPIMKTDIEGERFWYSYPDELYDFVADEVEK